MLPPTRPACAGQRTPAAIRAPPILCPATGPAFRRQHAAPPPTASASERFAGLQAAKAARASIPRRAAAVSRRALARTASAQGLVAVAPVCLQQQRRAEGISRARGQVYVRRAPRRSRHAAPPAEPPAFPWRTAATAPSARAAAPCAVECAKPTALAPIRPFPAARRCVRDSV